MLEITTEASGRPNVFCKSDAAQGWGQSHHSITGHRSRSNTSETGDSKSVLAVGLDSAQLLDLEALRAILNDCLTNGRHLNIPHASYSLADASPHNLAAPPSSGEQVRDAPVALTVLIACAGTRIRGEVAQLAVHEADKQKRGRSKHADLEKLLLGQHGSTGYNLWPAR